MSTPSRPLDQAAAWMRFAVCQDFPELPWLADRDQATAVERISMAGACRSCGVFDRCAAFVAAELICGGFWAGDFRDVPETGSDTPGVTDVVGQQDREPVAS